MVGQLVLSVNNLNLKKMRNENQKEMDLITFHTQTEIGFCALNTHTQKNNRLDLWENKLSKKELQEYKSGLSDDQRYILRKKYNY